MPEVYESKSTAVKSFETEFYTQARRKFMIALETGNIDDLRIGAEIFERSNMLHELNSLVNTHFANIATKTLMTLQQGIQTAVSDPSTNIHSQPKIMTANASAIGDVHSLYNVQS